MTSDGSTFYKCPIPDACLPGNNGSRSACAEGYTSIACSLCQVGYFEQFGKCIRCPSTTGASVLEMLGIGALLVVVGTGMFLIRTLLPVDVIKLGLSMLQVRPFCFFCLSRR